MPTIPGAPPSLDKVPTGCAFAPRCEIAGPAYPEAVPPQMDMGAGRPVRCIKSLAIEVGHVMQPAALAVPPQAG